MFRSSEEIDTLDCKIQVLKTLFYLHKKGLLRDLKHEPIDIYVYYPDDDYRDIEAARDLLDIIGFKMESVLTISDIYPPDMTDDDLHDNFKDLIWELGFIDLNEMYQVTLTNPTILKALRIAQEQDRVELERRIEKFLSDCMDILPKEELEEYVDGQLSKEEVCLINQGIERLNKYIEDKKLTEHGVVFYLDIEGIRNLYYCLYPFMLEIYDFSLDIIERSNNKEDDVYV